MASYHFWTEQAQRWSASVDYASPTTAWTQEMFDVLKQFNGNTQLAMKEIRLRRVEAITYESSSQVDWTPEMHTLLDTYQGDIAQASAEMAKRRQQRRAEFEASISH